MSIFLKIVQAFNSDTVDWLNFAVFLNAWNLSSHELGLSGEDRSRPGTWHIVNSLLERYILDKFRSMGPDISSLGCDLPTLVQLVAEPLAWHGLIIQSCVRSTLPPGKRKKKSGAGAADQSNSPISNAVRHSIQSLCSIVEEIMKWLRVQIKKPEDENVEILLSSFQRKAETETETKGPGQVFQVLQDLTSSASDIELGDRICQALKPWSHIDVARKLVTGQRKVLSEFLHICDSKFRLLQSLKQQI